MIVGVLGSTGFVGKNLMATLANHNIRHYGCSRITGVDVSDRDKLIDWLERHRVTHVVNLAAECGGIGLNQQRPADLWLATTKIIASVLEAAQARDLQKVVLVGTVCSYSKDTPVPFKESYLMCYGEPEETNSAYGVAKLSALHGGRAFHKQYGLPVCNLLPVNMYGPHDHFDLDRSHVIPAIINKIHLAKVNQTPLTLWGTGSATREFIYAPDFCEAVVLALKHLESPEFINIGTGSEISIKALVDLIADIMEYKGQISWDSSKPDGQPRRSLDVSRAHEKLGFTAQTQLVDGLRRTIEWFYNDYLPRPRVVKCAYPASPSSGTASSVGTPS